MTRRLGPFVLVPLVLLLVLPIAARAQYQFYPNTHSPINEESTPADIVVQDGFHKTAIVKILNLTPYTMELRECEHPPCPPDAQRRLDQTDRDRHANKGFMFAPVGVPAVIPPGSTDIEGLHGDPSAHPRTFVISWNDPAGGTVDKTRLNWVVKDVDWMSCSSPADPSTCTSRKSDVYVGLWVGRGAPPPEEELREGPLGLILGIVHECVAILEIVVEPFNPVAWYGAILSTIVLAKDSIEFAEDQKKPDGPPETKNYVAAYTIPDTNRECYFKNNAYTWAQTHPDPLAPGYYLPEPSDVPKTCIPGLGLSADAYDAQWGDTQSGGAPAELVVLTGVVRGRAAVVHGRDGPSELGSVPEITVAVMTATQYDASHLSLLASARPPMATANPGPVDLDKVKVVKEARKFREKYGVEGRRAVAWVLATLGPEQRQLVRDAVLTLLERRPISPEQEKFLLGLLKQSQQLIQDSRKEG